MPEFEHITWDTSSHAGGRAMTRVGFPTRRFDGNAVRELFELSNQLPPAPRLLVDCGGLELVPSGAMGMLVTIRKRFMSSGGQLHVAVPDARIRGAFAAARMDRILSLFESVERAVEAFK